MAETADVSAQTQGENMDVDDNNGLENRQRRYECGDFCSFNIFKIPGLLLRNIIFPKEQWDEYPDGFDHIADHFVFQPQGGREYVPTPDDFDLRCDYEEVSILTKDKIKLHAFLIKASYDYDNMSGASLPFYDIPLDSNDNELQWCTSSSSSFPTNKVPTIIYFHGNSGNCGYCLDVVKRYKSHPLLTSCNYLLVDYRGYGMSEGQQSEKGVYADAKAAFKYVESRNDLNSKKIVLMGQSLGGAVCVHLASRRRYRKKIAGLILENTFTSIPLMAKNLTGLAAIDFLPKCCYSSKFETINKIGRVKCPTLFIGAVDDEIVPHEMMEILYEKCNASVKIFEKFNHVGHNDTFTADEYVSKVAGFMKTYLNLSDFSTLQKTEETCSNNDSRSSATNATKEVIQLVESNNNV